jgi:hypothetical protein
MTNSGHCGTHGQALSSPDVTSGPKGGRPRPQPEVDNASLPEYPASSAAKERHTVEPNVPPLFSLRGS